MYLTVYDDNIITHSLTHPHTHTHTHSHITDHTITHHTHTHTSHITQSLITHTHTHTLHTSHNHSYTHSHTHTHSQCWGFSRSCRPWFPWLWSWSPYSGCSGLRGPCQTGPAGHAALSRDACGSVPSCQESRGSWLEDISSQELDEKREIHVRKSQSKAPDLWYLSLTIVESKTCRIQRITT